MKGNKNIVFIQLAYAKKKTPKNKTGQDKLEQWLAVSRNGYWAEYQDWEGYFSLYIFYSSSITKHTLFFLSSSLNELQFPLIIMPT